MDACWDAVSRKAWFDWVCLFLIINPYFLCYYGYDSIGAIIAESEKLFNTDKEGIGILYAVYSIPVIFSIFVIGLIIDKFGTRKTALVLSVMAFVGAVLVAQGHRHYGILVLGRILFGLGSESMSVTAQKMLAHRFKDSLLSLAFGFQILWGQLGSCAVFLLMPIFAEQFGTIAALWTVPIYGLFSLMTTAIYCWIDWKYESELKARPSPPVSRQISFEEPTSPTTPFTNGRAQLRKKSTDSAHGDIQDANSEDGIRSPQSETFVVLDSVMDSTPPPSSPPSRMELQDLKSLTVPFWVLLGLYFSVSSSFFVWNSFGSDRLQQKYGYSPKIAGTVVALSNLAAMISPLTGFIVDKFGHRTKFICSGTVLMLAVYCMISLTDAAPSLWYIFLGIGISLCQPIVFASVSLVVKESIIGTAFALMSLAMNIGQMSFPPVIGALHKRSGSYDSGNWVFIALGVVSLGLAIYLWYLERHIKLLDFVGIRPPPNSDIQYTHIEMTTPLQIETSESELEEEDQI